MSKGRVRLTIWAKLGFSFLIIAILVALVGYISVRKRESVITASIGEDAQRLARELMNDIDEKIYIRSEDMQAYAQDVSLAKAASASNAAFANLTDVQAYITGIDRDWIDKKNTPVSSGPHHQDSGEAKIRESTAGVSRKPSSDCKACGCSSRHLCGLTAWNT